MEDIEYYVKLMQRQRLHNESKLKLIETESEVVHKNFMKTLQDLKSISIILSFISVWIAFFYNYMINNELFTGETEQCKDSITKNLNTLVAFKHSIHKIVHSSQDISGLPVPHDCAEYIGLYILFCLTFLLLLEIYNFTSIPFFRYVKTMFRDVIEVCNNMGDIYKTLSNVKEYNVDPLKLIEDVVNIRN